MFLNFAVETPLPISRLNLFNQSVDRQLFQVPIHRSQTNLGQTLPHPLINFLGRGVSLFFDNLFQNNLAL